MLQSHKGSLFAIVAFVLWGLFPLYFKKIVHIDPFEVLANRIIWSAIFLLFLLYILKNPNRLSDIYRHPKKCFYLLVATIFIALNWGTYIWAVTNNQVIEASLGYYINPLVNIFLGFVILGERLRRLQWLAVVLAAIGVVIQIVMLGKVPWVALVLAFSFGFYGFIHKVTNIDSFFGLFVETLLLFPLAFMFIAFLWGQQSGPMVWSESDWLLLILAGPVTVIPLLFFTAATKRINYSSIGFFQYIGPSLLFLLATFYYQEPFSTSKLVTFILIWTALVILSFDAIRFNANLTQDNELKTK